jgi:dihydrofolate synthase/folylpolyglutamate synthase
MLSNLTNYNETVNYLYSLQKHGIKLGLANTNRLMQLLGHPQKSFRAIHIAGTNGKGSTASAIASILHATGLKVGLFTSPHLVSFTERIKINNLQISEPDVIKLACEVHQITESEDLNPTFFEFITAMAFHHFSINAVDWAVIETGMGGRLDATNIVAPDITIITNISLDHSEFLGKSISEIAFEKAGIIKPHVPVVTAADIPEAISQMTDTADSKGSELHLYNREFKGSLISMNDQCITFDYQGYNRYENLSAPVTGKHQLYNICLAIRASEILCQSGLPVTDASVITGLQNLRLEGRLEWFSHTPPIILDGAHNAEAANSLSASIKKIFTDKEIIVIAGIMDDKDIKGILKPLLQIADSLILTKAKYDRAASPEKLKEIISEITKSDMQQVTGSTIYTGSVKEAIYIAKKQCKDNKIILITGSFYTTGEAKEILGCTGVLSSLRE